MNTTIKVFRGKSFSSFKGFYDCVIVSVDDVEVRSFVNNDDAAIQYAIGLRDAFVIAGYSVITENKLLVEL